MTSSCVEGEGSQLQPLFAFKVDRGIFPPPKLQMCGRRQVPVNTPTLSSPPTRVQGNKCIFSFFLNHQGASTAGLKKRKIENLWIQAQNLDKLSSPFHRPGSLDFLNELWKAVLREPGPRIKCQRNCVVLSRRAFVIVSSCLAYPY